MIERIRGTLSSWGFVIEIGLELALEDGYVDFDGMLQEVEGKALAG